MQWIKCDTRAGEPDAGVFPCLPEKVTGSLVEQRIRSAGAELEPESAAFEIHVELERIHP